MEIPRNTHALVPGDTTLTYQKTRPVPQGSDPGTINPFAARFIGIAAPVGIAGWGYDLFGRPCPGAISLEKLNGKVNSEGSEIKDYSLTRFISPNSANGTKFPGGGESSPAHHVGGMLDVRYDPRHGLWRTNHYFLAEITGVVSTGNSIFSNRYLWREVEFHKITDPDPTTRSFDSTATSPFPYPARSFIDANNAIINYAINLSESSSDKSDRILHKIPSGTIVQMRTVNTIKNYVGNDPYLNDYQPLYIFEQPGYNSVFLKIVGYDGTYPSPLSEADGIPPDPANYNGGKMQTRWMYRGVVVTFSGVSNFNSFRHTTPFGSFVEDTSIPESIRKVQCINLIEIGNPPGKRGMICPGVVTATGNSLTASQIWPDGVPGSITLAANTKSSYPKGFAVQPICSGTIVEARRLASPNGVGTYGPIYYFQVPNAHDGGCSSGIWPFFGTTTESPFEPNTVTRTGV